jgi:hypothetical protein
VFAIFADAKLGHLIPAVNIGVREQSEIFHLSITWLPLLDTAEDASLRLGESRAKAESVETRKTKSNKNRNNERMLFVFIMGNLLSRIRLYIISYLRCTKFFTAPDWL